MKVSDGYRESISVRGNLYNKAHDNFRLPIEGVINRFFNKYKILDTPNDDSPFWEALSMVYNINVEDGQDIGGDEAVVNETLS